MPRFGRFSPRILLKHSFKKENDEYAEIKLTEDSLSKSKKKDDLSMRGFDPESARCSPIVMWPSYTVIDDSAQVKDAIDDPTANAKTRKNGKEPKEDTRPETGFSVIGFGSTPDIQKVTSSQANAISNLVMKATSPVVWKSDQENKHLLSLLKYSSVGKGCVNYVVEKIVLRLTDKIETKGARKMMMSVHKSAVDDVNRLPALRYSDSFAEDTLTVLKALKLVHQMFNFGNDAFKAAFKTSKNLKRNLLIIGTSWNKSHQKVLMTSARSINIRAEANLV